MPARDDHDGAWKEALEKRLYDFLSLLFPDLHAELDTRLPPVFLDKELARLHPRLRRGRRIVDKLVRVRRRDAKHTLLLIHVEVAGQPDDAFPERMLVYNSRILDGVGQPVVSLAVLADTRRSWRPSSWRFELCGFVHELRFPVAKLIDWEGREQELERSESPFAVFVLAYLAALRTKGQAKRRLQWKRKILRGLLGRGWPQETIRELFRLVDWVLRLPEKVDDRLLREIEEEGKRSKMEFVSSLDRAIVRRALQREEPKIRERIRKASKRARMTEERARKRAEERARRTEAQAHASLRKALLVVLGARFGEVPASVLERLEAIDDGRVLARLVDRAGEVPTMERFAAELRRSRSRRRNGGR